MARPRKEEGLKRTIVQRGEKFYAYESTSSYIDGKKFTESKYLGRVDPDTNELMEKIPGKTKEDREKIAKEREISILKGISPKEYGGAYLLHSIQERTTLGEDLMRSFGLSGKSILAAAMALTMYPGAFMDIEHTLRRTSIRTMYGLTGSLDSGTLSRFTKQIGEASLNMDHFFELRVGSSEGTIAWDTTTNGTYSTMDGLAEYVVNNKDNEKIRQTKTGIATDMRGVPIMIRTYPGTLSDLATVDRLVEDVERYGRNDTIFVFDRGFGSGANIHYLLEKNTQFVIPANVSAKAFKSLLTEFRTINEKKNMVHGGHSYTVWKTPVGLKENSDRESPDGSAACDFTLPGEEDHGKDGLFTAYVCFDSKKYSDEIQRHNLLINDLISKAAKIDSKDPVRAFGKLAGKAMKHFTVIPNGRNVIVEEKKNSASFTDNRAGLFIMLSSEGSDWRTVMDAYDVRRFTEQVFDAEKSDDKRHRTSDRYTMEGRLFVRFVSLIMRCEMTAFLRENNLDSKYSVSGILSSLNCIMSMNYGETWGLNEITANCRRIFTSFDIPVPDEVLRNVEPCDLLHLMGPKFPSAHNHDH